MVSKKIFVLFTLSEKLQIKKKRLLEHSLFEHL